MVCAGVIIMCSMGIGTDIVIECVDREWMGCCVHLSPLSNLLQEVKHFLWFSHEALLAQLLQGGSLCLVTHIAFKLKHGPDNLYS